MSTRRYILTGAPGAGKTAILRALEGRGCDVTEEAATDVIAAARARGNEEPWKHPGFINDIVLLQRRRQEASALRGFDVQIYDRSPICTLALASYLGRPVSPALSEEINRIIGELIYDARVCCSYARSALLNQPQLAGSRSRSP